MARVNVNINANDLSGGGLRSLRDNIRRVDQQIRGAGGRITVTLNDQDTVRGAERIRRAIDEIPNHVRVRVRVSESGESDNRVVRGVRRTFAPAQGLVSGMMEDGIGQGLLQGFQNAAKNPLVLAGFATLVVSVVAMLGAAIAGAVTLGFGGAFVALGGYLESKSKPVKEAWKKAAKEVKNEWKNAGAALEPVIMHGISLMEKLSRSFLPHFKDAMQDAAGPLSDFLDKVAQGVKGFGKRAFKPMMDAFDTFLLAFGPQLKDMLKGLGDSFGALGRTVSSHSGEISIALIGILGLITTIVDIVNFLANAWVAALRIMTGGIGYFTKYVLGGLVRAFGWVIEAILELLSHIPFIGKYFKSAKQDVTRFVDETVLKLNIAGQASIDWGKRMDRANRKRKLQVDIASWKAQLTKARADLKKTTNQKAKAKLKADISNLENKLAKARRDLRAINGATATTYVQLFRKATSADKNADGVPDSIARRTGGIVGMATGGLARSSASARGVLVGEAGPEIVSMSPGSHVTPAPRTRSILQNAGGQAPVQEINLIVDGVKLATVIYDPLRGVLRSKGKGGVLG